MDFFSGSVPNLISKRSIKNIEKIANIKNPIKEVSIFDSINSFYNNFIEPNIFILSMLFIFIIFLIYKYYAKNNITKNQYNPENIENFRAMFNPNLPIDIQNSYVNYLPDKIPSTIDGELVSYDDLVKKEEPEYRYPPFIENTENRDIYTGTYNTYQNSQDSAIPHPFGWPMNYNSSTEKSIKYMTNLNQKNLDDLNDINNEEENDLIYYSQNNNYQLSNSCI